jgi:hypothetical protein
METAVSSICDREDRIRNAEMRDGSVIEDGEESDLYLEPALAPPWPSVEYSSVIQDVKTEVIPPIVMQRTVPRPNCRAYVPTRGATATCKFVKVSRAAWRPSQRGAMIPRTMIHSWRYITSPTGVPARVPNRRTCVYHCVCPCTCRGECECGATWGTEVVLTYDSSAAGGWAQFLSGGRVGSPKCEHMAGTAAQQVQC